MVEVSVEAAEAGAAYRLTQARAALNKARGKQSGSVSAEDWDTLATLVTQQADQSR